MNLRMQLIRAGIAMAALGGIATAETLIPPADGCPFAHAAHPQRIMLLDPMQKHPTWIDAPSESSAESSSKVSTVTTSSAADSAATVTTL